MDEDSMKKLLNNFKEEIKTTISDAKDELKEEIGIIKEKVIALENNNEEVKKEIDNLRAENYHLRVRMQELEDYSRKDNIVIHGIVEETDETDEDLVGKVIELGKSLGVPLEPYDIHACHRLPSKGPILPTIVKLNNRTKKNKLIKRSKEARIKNVYVNHHLSKISTELYREAREGKTKKKWEFTWVNDKQQVFIRIKQNTPAIRIISSEQLQHLAEKAEMDHGPRTRNQVNQNTRAMTSVSSNQSNQKGGTTKTAGNTTQNNNSNKSKK